MKKIILGIIGLVVVVGIIAYLYMQNSANVAVTTPAPTNVETTTTPAPALPTTNMLALAENVSGSTAIISRATLTQAGYVVIYRADTTGKVTVIGHSALLEPGDHTNVPVTMSPAVKAKDIIVAVLYRDNGDGVFDIAGGDLPVVQDNAHISAVDVIDVPQAATDTNLVASVEVYLKTQIDQMMKTATTTVKTTTTTTTTTKNVLAVTVHGSNYKFNPLTITAKLGQTVRVTFVSDGGVHDFVIDEFKVKMPQIQSGKSEIIEFVANKKGSFEYYCSVGQHRAMGMKGTLIVE